MLDLRYFVSATFCPTLFILAAIDRPTPGEIWILYQSASSTLKAKLHRYYLRLS